MENELKQDDLIRRRDALEKLRGIGITAIAAYAKIRDIPAVDAVEVRHGHWIECEDVTIDVYYRCSVCRNEWDIIEGTPEDNNMKYCPECGARMDERKEDGLYESLIRGLEEAIAYENGEIECRTETREGGDA